jgi:hypothetical protein
MSCCYACDRIFNHTYRIIIISFATLNMIINVTVDNQFDVRVTVLKNGVFWDITPCGFIKN